jgi:hypothetical protein
MEEWGISYAKLTLTKNLSRLQLDFLLLTTNLISDAAIHIRLSSCNCMFL